MVWFWTGSRTDRPGFVLYKCKNGIKPIVKTKK